MPNKIEGTKVWTYVASGPVPPGVTDDLVVQSVLNNVAWSGAFLAFMKSQHVTVRKITPEELAALGGGPLTPLT